MSGADHEILATGFQFCEAPRIGPDGSAYFSDLTGGGFYRVAGGGGPPVKLTDRRWIGGSAFDADGRMIVSGEGGLAFLSADGTLETLLSEIDGRPIVAVNDIEADDVGGLFFGTIDFPAILGRGMAGEPGALYRLDPSGRIDLIRDGVPASNGMGFSPDRARFYHSECSSGIWEYDYAPGGLPRDGRLLIELHDSDGLAVDDTGHIWAAVWSAGEIHCYSPEGKRVDRIPLPFPNVVSLDFGGPARDALYVTTGGTGADGTPVGGLIRLRPGVAGQPSRAARLSRSAAAR